MFAAKELCICMCNLDWTELVPDHKNEGYMGGVAVKAARSL